MVRFRQLIESPLVRDAAVALVAFALTLAVLGLRTGTTRSLDALGVLLAAISCFPLLVHRRAPLGTFALTTSASATLNGLGYALGPPFGPTFALLFVAADERTRTRLKGTAIVVLVMFAIHIGATTIAYNGFPTSPILFGVLLWGGAWVISDRVRQRRQRLALLVERAERAQRDAERDSRVAAAEERTRIARDLHDSAAHSINVILVQAGAARLLQEHDPGSVREALETIEDVARETIGEIDQLVSGLREAGAAGNSTDGVELPIGLAALDTLIERHRVAGLSVETRVRGPRRSLALGLDQAAYRILQESLTNAARHGSGRAKVEIAYGDRQLELTISNPTGRSPKRGAPEGGHGILGMRERAALLGGTLEAGAFNGSFRVHARLPYAQGDEAA
jgi:signal transduction histidine kinase